MTAHPTLALIATGGTIAGSSASRTDTTGYAAGALTAQSLMDGLPQMMGIADIRAEQLFSIDSKDADASHWLRLARRAQALLDCDDIEAVVITHGTDTLEETAFFLDCSLDTRRKPVVITGAMRPATALSADGPMNLYDAVCAAADPDSAGRGVLVCFNRCLFRAATLRKHHTHALDAFSASEEGPVGHVAPIRYFAPPCEYRAPRRLPGEIEELPRVDILYVAPGSAPDLFEHAIHLGARGVVLVLPGNGSLPARWSQAVTAATAGGIPVVRASRCNAGFVSGHELDVLTGTRPAGALSAATARIALMLELLHLPASGMRAETSFRASR